MNIQVRIIPLSFLLALALLFVSLGQWQVARKAEKQALLKRWYEAPELSMKQALDSQLDFARVRILGNYESDWQVLLDNKVFKGRPGVHVLSLFHSNEGTPLLVDRGWLPMNPDRRSLPNVQTPEGEVVISGLLSRPPGDGVKLGVPDVIDRLEGGVLVTYLDIDTIESSAGFSIAPLILKLDAEDTTGFEDRDWQPAVILPAQHQAYAVQWYALAAAAIVLIFTLGIRFRRSGS